MCVFFSLWNQGYVGILLCPQISWLEQLVFRAFESKAQMHYQYCDHVIAQHNICPGGEVVQGARLESKGSLVRFPVEPYIIFILNCLLVPLPQLGAHANEIKHEHSPVFIVVFRSRQRLIIQGLYIHCI